MVLNMFAEGWAAAAAVAVAAVAVAGAVAAVAAAAVAAVVCMYVRKRTPHMLPGVQHLLPSCLSGTKIPRQQSHV